MSEQNLWPKISIVTPNLNQGQYLELTIESVLSQNYPNLEYVVVDGGSSDDSLQIIQKYSSKLKLIRQKSKGHYQGIQEGFDVCTGDLMGWLNSDDMLVPGSLEVLARLFTQFPKVDWITGVPSLMDEDDRLVMTYPLHRHTRWETLLGQSSCIQQESTFWRRSLWTRAGAHFDMSFTLAADYELWLRFFRHAQLHSAHTHFGQFRLRLENQKSYTEKSKYDSEVARATELEIAALSAEARKKLERLQDLTCRLESWKSWAPGKLLSRLEFQRTKLLERPFGIIFDRERYEFKMEELP